MEIETVQDDDDPRTMQEACQKTIARTLLAFVVWMDDKIGDAEGISLSLSLSRSFEHPIKHATVAWEGIDVD